jgi:hypothetical protein
MSIRYECEHCGSVLKIKNDLAGKPGKCPKCKTSFTVPNPIDETESLHEPGDVRNPPDEDSKLATTLSASDSSGDFDIDAFLMQDDSPGNSGGTTSVKTAKKTAKERQQGLSDDLNEEPKPKKSKSLPDADSQETFQIRRGPDADGRSVAAVLAGDDQGDETPVPARRPPGTNPNAPASNVASELLSLSAKKGKKTSWNDVDPQKKEEPSFDWDALKYELKTKLLPAVVGAVVLYGLFYFVLSPMFGDKPFVPKLAIVTGKATVDGKPLVGATIWFHPENKTQEYKGKKYKVGSSQGVTDSSGQFEMIYDKDNKGVVVGVCRVQVETPNYGGIAAQYLGLAATARREVKAGRQVIDLELTK